MPSAAAPPGRSWLGPALAVVGAVTLARIALLALARHDLFVDEAQYWLWGQDFAFGYYSKPPLIAWVIGASTTLAGSDAPFWIRLPAPLFHAATALILGAIAARHVSARAAVWVAAAFVTLPMVALGSLLISTDTIMFPFLALALGGYLGLLMPGGGGRPALAAGVGVALGIAFLAKYSAVFYLVLAAAAALRPTLRPVPGDAAAILAAFGLVIAPNLAWNVANGFATLSHTVDNSGWRQGLGLDPARPVEFLASQFLVMGPILFGALFLATVAAVRPGDGRGGGRVGHLLAALALPLVLIFTLQALASRANANWAAPAYLAGTLLAVPWLLGRARGWIVASFVINGALCLALPLAAMRADTLRVDGRLLLARYAGLDELSSAIRAEAEARGAAAILAEERAVLADLFHSLRDTELPIFAWPHDGPPRNHYEQRHSYPGGTGGPLFAVTRGGGAPPCAGAPAGVIEPGPGAYEGRPFRFWLVPPDCWSAP